MKSSMKVSERPEARRRLEEMMAAYGVRV